MNSLFVPPDCDLHMLSVSPVEQKEPKEEEEKTQPNKSVSHLQYLPDCPISSQLKLWFNLRLGSSDTFRHAPPSSSNHPTSWWLLWRGCSSGSWIHPSVLYHQYEPSVYCTASQKTHSWIIVSKWFILSFSYYHLSLSTSFHKLSGGCLLWRCRQ